MGKFSMITEDIGNSSGLLGSIMGYAMRGVNDRRQRNQQRRLMEIQMEGQKEMGEFNKGLALDMWNQTNYGAQRKHMEDAGLNVGLMYGMGGGGGVSTDTGAGGNVTGGIAPAGGNELEYGLQLGQQAAQIDLLKAQKNKIEAETKTTNESRDILIENMRQSGITQWLENELTEYKRKFPNADLDAPMEIIKNQIYDKSTTFDNQSIEARQLNADLLKTMAETEEKLANADLTNKRANGYWQELLNATAHADADKIRAAAIKLESEWGTGEYTNWKTWVDVGAKAIQTLSGAIKKGGVQINNEQPTTTINHY